jgi:peptidoglycan hydrolase-like protein with peptidoglycan-binding domain
MELIAFTHAALAYEDATPTPELRSLDSLTFNPPNSSWMSLLAIAVFVSLLSGDRRPATAAAQLGDEGASVEILQRTLSDQGFYFGITDGVFGPETEDAVIRFQIEAGLSTDGVVGSETEKALGISTTNLGTAPTGHVLQFGHAGPEIQAVQAALSQQAVYVGAIDGIYGVETREAVVAFQEMNGLEGDGVVGPDTIAALQEQMMTNPTQANLDAPPWEPMNPELESPALTPDAMQLSPRLGDSGTGAFPNVVQAGQTIPERLSLRDRLFRPRSQQ